MCQTKEGKWKSASALSGFVLKSASLIFLLATDQQSLHSPWEWHRYNGSKPKKPSDLTAVCRLVCEFAPAEPRVKILMEEKENLQANTAPHRVLCSGEILGLISFLWRVLIYLQSVLWLNKCSTLWNCGHHAGQEHNHKVKDGVLLIAISRIDCMFS